MSESRIMVVTGGRDSVDQRGQLWPEEAGQLIDLVHRLAPTIFRDGDGLGVDRAARKIVRSLGLDIRTQIWPADSDRHGRRAENVRNGNMLRGVSETGRDTGGSARWLVSFPGEDNTKDCAEQARCMKIEIFRIKTETIACSPNASASQPLSRSLLGYRYEEIMRKSLGGNISNDERAALRAQAAEVWSAMEEFDRHYVETWTPYLHLGAPRI